MKQISIFVNPIYQTLRKLSHNFAYSERSIPIPKHALFEEQQ